MRGDEGSVLVLSLSPLIPPAARNRRSAPLSPWSARRKWMTSGVGLSVSGWFENEFSIFHKWMNSMGFCYFCIELLNLQKLWKFLCDLCDVYYLRKIWTIDFWYFLNMIKIAQLINKWVSMIFLGLNNYPKIMKIVLPLSYHGMNLYKNFGLNWNKLIYFIIFN